jgi:oxygen-dependent protoporphyrinogen oxidase
MKDYLIIGAGLSGLTTGYYLKQAGFDVAIWEAQAQVGGRIQTQKSGDWQVDVGANTALVSSQPLHDLIDALGLRDQVMVANSMAKKRFIVRGDQLLPLPMSLGSCRAMALSRGGKIIYPSKPKNGRTNQNPEL